MKRKVTAYIIDAERVNFLLGRESIKELARSPRRSTGIRVASGCELSVCLFSVCLFVLTKFSNSSQK